MRSTLAIMALTVGLGLTGCTTNTKQISIKEVVDDVEGATSIVDTKIDKYLELIDQFPEEPKHRERIAAFYWQKEDHSRALDQLAVARKLDPKNTKYDYMEAQILQSLGNYTKAEEAYLRVLEKLPKERFTGPHYDLADLYLETDQTDKAMVQLQKCTAIDPADPLAHYYLGSIAWDRKQREQTIEHYERYMELGGERFFDQVRRRLLGLQPNLGRVRYTGE